MSAPRTAKLSGTVAWSTGELYDGFVLIGLNAGGTSAVPYLDSGEQRIRIPQFTKIRIRNGAFDDTAKLFWTADIEPPNTRYWAWWFDSRNVQIFPTSGDPSSFTVGADPYAISVPTLTAPTAPTTPPTPDS